MDKYEQEIFDFLTQRENFEAMLKLNNTYPIVKSNLLEQFWNLVEEKLLMKIKQMSGEWKVDNPSNKEHYQSKLMLYKESWRLKTSYPIIGLAWEHLYSEPYYGVWYDFDSKRLELDKLIQQLEEVRNKHKMKIEAGWWPAWRYGEYILSSDNNISFVLPDFRDNTAEVYAQTLLNLIPDVERIIDESIIQIE